MPIREIEKPLERCDVRIKRTELIEVLRERNQLIYLVIKANVAIISILCAVYAVYMQF